MAMIRCAMVLISRFHSSNRAGSFNIKETCAFQNDFLRRRGGICCENTHQSGAVSRRVADLAALEYGELALDTVGLLD